MTEAAPLAPLPTVEEICASCDATYIDRVLPYLEVRQAETLARAGRFWQGLYTHSVVPQNGKFEFGDIADQGTVPTAEGELGLPWPEEIENERIPFRVRVDCILTSVSGVPTPGAVTTIEFDYGEVAPFVRWARRFRRDPSGEVGGPWEVFSELQMGSTGDLF